MRLNIFIYCSLLLSGWLMTSCGSSNKVDTEKILSELDSINTNVEVPEIDNAMVEAVLQSVPSPLEISFLIKETGSAYDKNYLNSTSNVSKYSSGYEKAINLGIYGADLGYTNIFGKSQDGIFYLDAVTDLADQLNIGQFFEYSVIKDLIKHNDNVDSLLMITTSNFEKINNYLQNQNRSQLSAMLLYGGWLEGVNLLCRVHDNAPSVEIKERIGEQKIVLDQMILLLGFYEYDTNVKVLLEELKKLEAVYKNVTIETIDGETTFEVVDGMMVAKTNSRTEINFSDETLGEINSTVTAIRNQLIKG